MTIQQLERQRRLLSQLIGVERKRTKLLSQLNGAMPKAKPVVKTAPPIEPKKRGMSPAARRRVSARMKQYWAERRRRG